MIGVLPSPFAMGTGPAPVAEAYYAVTRPFERGGRRSISQKMVPGTDLFPAMQARQSAIQESGLTLDDMHAYG